MKAIDIVISNRLGLHARAAAKLTQLAGRFSGDIHISRDGRRVNAKSIMGVMMLAAGMGVRVRVDADGADADEALAAIRELFESRFGEDQ
ncbi:MAG: HPr family phosphocarrier protein [Castellaniella sp.]